MNGGGGTVAVSVICPTYNRSSKITETIESVRAQTFQDWELLVVSDGCDDDTEDWVRRAARQDPRVALHRIERSGHPSGPRNAGLALARGEFVAYLDHDDVWRPDHLRVLLSLLRAGADLAVTGCTYHDADGAEAVEFAPLSAFWHPELQVLGPMFEPSRVGHRRGVVEGVGGWRGGAGLEDWDLWLRLADAGRTVRTVVEPTAALLMDGGTRRNRMPRPHRLPLVVLDDARTAHALLGELRSGVHDEAFRAAVLADMRDWYRRMDNSGALVRPLDWDGDLDEEIERVVSGEVKLFEELVLVPEQGRYALARNLLCSRVEHARRASRLVPSVQPRVLRLVRDLAGAGAG
ncbi:glycosyltransferase family 2 protein [Streptomyces liangshanensis]|uniref:Glycosyltransferase family 2 protein n=1 Tax=Streptomyces liangshanensis TaxID=2717324 RepID=A0A6G9H081_9ACTN|nr:glycosyltransferase family A protein [Streptomyces liangshanensis]QIQ03943.1 glycosyltransferase family 2 protein [Streptomyces liangshanensis]